MDDWDKPTEFLPNGLPSEKLRPLGHYPLSEATTTSEPERRQKVLMASMPAAGECLSLRMTVPTDGEVVTSVFQAA
jgi:hypothetical protein